MDSDEADAAREELLGPAEDDDLEFHITFPTPSSSAPCNEGIDRSDSSQEFVFVKCGDLEPVVFLLGWAGCQDKNLAKYSRIYEDIGCITIRYTAPAEYIFLDQEKVRPLAVKLLDLIADLSLDDNPVFFHVFSNNGSIVYQHMCSRLQTDAAFARLASKVRGVSFDSAPGRRRPLSFLKATSHVIGGSSFVYRMLASLAMLAVAAVVATFRMLVGTVTGRRAPPSWFDYARDDSLVRPHLFLFSAADDIIPAADVEEVAEGRERAGCAVTRLCYDDSHHCQHLRKHRETYVNAVRTFVAACLNEAEG